MDEGKEVTEAELDEIASILAQVIYQYYRRDKNDDEKISDSLCQG